MDKDIRKIGNLTVRVITPDNQSQDEISLEDKDMDIRAVAAVESAIHKAEICNKPIAKYDSRKKKAYVKQADGVKKYVD